MGCIPSKLDIYFPESDEEYLFYYQAVKGGLVYPTSYEWHHPDLEKIERGEITYKELDHYLLCLDVVSLYVSAMYVQL